MNDTKSALSTLHQWLTQNGHDSPGPKKDAWGISMFRDAFLFAPSGARRSNQLHMVLSHQVMTFNPATATAEDTYNSMS